MEESKLPPLRPTKREPAMSTKDAAQWICDTCLHFGSTVATAHKVAGLFAEALDQTVLVN